MKNLIKLEELAMFAIFAPDVSMLSYMAGNTTGSFSYNLFHHKGVAILFFLGGIILNNQILLVTGIILFGHSSLDRMLGFGLKYKEGFGFTRLGKIGKEK